MKRAGIFTALLLLVAFALPSTAGANSVKISGDLRKDGHLTIDFKWNVDTRNFQGKNNTEIRKLVFEQMYNAMLPELDKKTRGLHLSYDKSDFTLINDSSRLVQERSDGSKLYSVSCTVRFNAPFIGVAEDAPCPKASAQQTNIVRGKWQREFW